MAQTRARTKTLLGFTLASYAITNVFSKEMSTKSHYIPANPLPVGRDNGSSDFIAGDKFMT